MASPPFLRLSLIALSMGCGASTSEVDALREQVVTLQQTVDAQETSDDPAASAAELAGAQASIRALETELAAAQSRIEQLESALGGLADLAPYVQVAPEEDAIRIVGANVYIQSGAGATNGDPSDPRAVPYTANTNGLGNLIIGYGEQGDWTLDRSGSHNLVVGIAHEWSSYGNLISGEHNHGRGPYGTVLGGQGNLAGGAFETVLGGQGNHALGTRSVVVGGEENITSGLDAVIVGGHQNESSGDAAVAIAGKYGHASGARSVVVGGGAGDATGMEASVIGGYGGEAEGIGALTLGGSGLRATATGATTVGGEDAVCDTEYGVVLGE